MAGTYKLVRHTHTYKTTRSDQWNPYEVTERSWWIEGPGVYRPAMPEEYEIAEEILRRVLHVVKPFDDYVNIGHIGSTPTEAIKKEFGL